MQTANSTSCVLNDHIIPSDLVKNLGVYFDKDLSMKTHINKLLQMSFAWLRKIRSIKNYLNQESLKILLSPLVLSRIDYGNIVLMGLPKLQTQKIQSIINTTARLIPETRKFDHITPVSKVLHWLKIEERIQYKMILQVHKCLKMESSSYLSSKLSTVTSLPERKRLRSWNTMDIAKVGANTILGNRRLEVAAPILWWLSLIILKHNFRVFFSQIFFIFQIKLVRRKKGRMKGMTGCVWIEG